MHERWGKREKACQGHSITAHHDIEIIDLHYSVANTQLIVDNTPRHHELGVGKHQLREKKETENELHKLHRRSRRRRTKPFSRSQTCPSYSMNKFKTRNLHITSDEEKTRRGGCKVETTPHLSGGGCCQVASHEQCGRLSAKL